MGLDSIEFVLTVERELGLSLPDEEIEKVATVGQLTDLVWNYIQSGNSKMDLILLPTSRAAVYEYIAEVLVVDFGIKGNLITESATFGRDLGLD